MEHIEGPSARRPSDAACSCDALQPWRHLKTRREFVRLAGLAGAALAGPPWLSACLEQLDPFGPTLDDRSGPGRLEGYADATSYRPGDTARFFISNRSPTTAVYVDVLRVGAMDQRVMEPWPIKAGPLSASDDASQNGCRWPEALELQIPFSWKSGVYFLRLWSDGFTNAIPFVVKAPSRASAILYQLPVATYQAYNLWGGSSLYTHDAQQYTNPFVSFDRPYKNLGNFRRWDAPFIRWMEQAGFEADYCTSVDLHNDPALQLANSGYQLLLSVGHDEYWSWEMRDNVEAFIAAGGNVAFFGGNTCWWQIRLEPGARGIVCYKDPQRSVWRDPLFAADPDSQRRVTTNWGSGIVNRPEEKMTGVSYRFGAGYSGTPRALPTNVAFHIGPSQHWAFAGLPGTSLDFGYGTVGYETDAACLSTRPDGSVDVDEHGIPLVCDDRADGRSMYSPPDSIMVLATTDLLDWPLKVGRATMVVFRDNGMVFNAATTNWAVGLATSDSVRVVTANVMRHLLQRSPVLANTRFEEGTGDTRGAQLLEARGAALPLTSWRRSSRSDLLLGPSSTVDTAAMPSQAVTVRGRTYYVISCWIRSGVPINPNDGSLLRVSLRDAITNAEIAAARYTAVDGGWQHVRAYVWLDVDGSVSTLLAPESSFEGGASFTGLRIDAL